MKDGAPFGVAGIWENWKEPASSEWIRTFAILTADANELVDDIHDRMTIILVTEAYTRSLSHEPAPPRDLVQPSLRGCGRGPFRRASTSLRTTTHRLLAPRTRN